MEPAAGECEKGLLVVHARKSTPPPFLVKTYMLVEDPDTNGVVSWNEDGSGFVVWQPVEFARDLLPTLFKHCNFSSFIRQLNTYGFRKVTTNRWEFCNGMFRKGERDMLRKIRRRKGITSSNNSQNHRRRNNNKAGINKKQEEAAAAAAAINNAMISAHHDQSDEDQRSSSTSSSSCFSTLLDENAKLKQENGVLNDELVSMRKKCKDLLDLVGVYANSEKEDRRPKLFGVRLGVEGDEKEKKRKRMEMIMKETGFLLSQSCK